MTITNESLLRFLADDLAIDVASIMPNSLLFSTGIIDSFSLVTLMTYVETEGGFRISPTDVNLANFDSIARISAYVARAMNPVRQPG
jgi:acyl carrier protein